MIKIVYFCSYQGHSVFFCLCQLMPKPIFMSEKTFRCKTFSVANKMLKDGKDGSCIKEISVVYLLQYIKPRLPVF